MNKFIGHTHLPSDIIGLGSIVLSGGGGSGTSSVEFAKISALNGQSLLASRSDHRHKNILSTDASGNIAIEELTDSNDGISKIKLKSTVSNITLDSTNTFKPSDELFTIQHKSFASLAAKFDLSLLGTAHTYQLPNKDGVIVVSSQLSDGTMLPSQPPPNKPIINATLSYSTLVNSTSTITVAIDYDGVVPFNLAELQLRYREVDQLLQHEETFLYRQDGESFRLLYTWPAFLSITGLVCGKSYEFFVQAMDATGSKSGWSSGVILSAAKDASLPDTPENLTVQYTGGNHIIAQWAINDDVDIDKYELYMSPLVQPIVYSDAMSATADIPIYIGRSNIFTASINTGTPVYYFKLVAIDFSGNRSIPQQYTLSIPTAPSVPVLSSILLSTGVTSNPWIDISFHDSSSCAGILPYIYSIAPTAGGFPEKEFVGSAATSGGDASFRFLNVIGNIVYRIKVASISNLNIQSDFVTVPNVIRSAASTIAPNCPTSVVSSSGFGSIDIRWTNSLDEDLSSVNIYRNTVNNSGSAIYLSNVIGTYFSDKTVSSATTYYYWLKSKNTSNLLSIFSTGVSGASVQVLPEFLDTTARVDFIVKDVIFKFDHVESGDASKTLRWESTGGILSGGKLYSISSSGSIDDANNSYLIATLNTLNDTAELSILPFSSEPTLLPNQSIIAITSTNPLTETNNYVCYVRQSNSVSIEGALIREATITSAKIKELDAEKIIAGTITSREISGGSITGDKLSVNSITSREISAGSITADRLSISSREAILVGIVFTTNASGLNTLAWTSGTLNSIAISAGNVLWTSGNLYIYWDGNSGSSIFKTTSLIDVARANGCKLIATYCGDINLYMQYGETIIDGGNIKTDTISANNIKTDAITAVKIKSDSITSVKIEASAVTTEKIKVGAITTDRLEVGNRSIIVDEFSDDPAISGYTILQTGATMSFSSRPNDGMIGNDSTSFIIPA